MNLTKANNRSGANVEENVENYRWKATTAKNGEEIPARHNDAWIGCVRDPSTWRTGLNALSNK